MTFDFTVKEFILGGGTGTPTFQFYRRGFGIGNLSQPTWKDVVISGIGSLTLVNAKANGLNYLKLFGGTEQPPETYIDSVTLEGKCEQRNVPEGYTQASYLSKLYSGSTNDTVCFDTGFIPQGDEVIEIDFTMINPPTSFIVLFGQRIGAMATSPRNYWLGINGSSQIVARFGTVNITENINIVANKKYHCVIDLQNCTISIDNNTYSFANSTVSGIEKSLYLFSLNSDDASSLTCNGTATISNFRIKRNGRDVYTAIPTTNLGIYDTVNNTLNTNIIGANGTITAGSSAAPTPDIPIDIVCNNGTIKASKNLLNNPNYVKGLLGDNGILNTTNGTCALDYYPVEPNTTYTFSFIKQRDVRYDRVCEYSNNDESSFLNLAVKQNNADTPAIGSTIVMTFTTTANTHYIRMVMACSYLYEDGTPENAQLEQGSTATPYHPYGEIYYDGTVETVTDSNQLTATAQPLLSVGNYKDTQEVLSGAVIRNVGVKPIKGSMVTNYFPSSNRCIISTGNIIATHTPILCTHFPVTTLGDYYINHSSDNQFIYCYSKDCSSLEDYQNFFDNLYNAGTPVIVVYPTSSATTETVTPQVLQKSPVTYSGSITGLTGTVVESSHTVPTPTQPLDIVANNGVIKLSPNLIDESTLYKVSSTMLRYYSTPSQGGFDLKANTTYTLSTDNPDVYVYFYDYDTKTSLASGKNYKTYTPTEDIKVYFTLYLSSGIPEDTHIQLEIGSTATTYRPYGSVYYDGTVEKVEVYSDIAITDSEVIDGQGINSQNGILISNADRCVFTPFFAKAGTKITWSATSDRLGGYLIQYNQPVISAQYWISSIPASAIEHTGNRYSRYAITTTDCYVVCQGTAKWSEMKQNDWKVTKPFESATAQPLLKVGTYQDVQNITTGEVTRNLGVYVVTGAEDWSYNDRYERYNATINSIERSAPLFEFLCTHGVSSTGARETWSIRTNKILAFYDNKSEFASLDIFKKFFADEYEAGHPAIIVYGKDTPTTESVTPQPLTIQAGTNIVEITQASIDNLELEVSYKAGVEVTVEEIEAVNNDESVEVTING